MPSSIFLPIESDSDRDSPGESGDNNPPQPLASGSRDYERARDRVGKLHDSPTSSSGHGHGRSESKYGSTGVTPPLFGRGGANQGRALPNSHGSLKRSESPPPVELPQPALPPPPELSSSTVRTGHASDKGKNTHDATRMNNAPAHSMLSVSNSADPRAQNTSSRVSLSRSKSEQLVRFMSALIYQIDVIH